MQLSQKQIQHLFLRAGFGITKFEKARIHNWDKHQVVDYVFKSSEEIEPLDEIVNPLAGSAKTFKELSKERQKEVRKNLREQMKNLNLGWTHRMVKSKASLREKMTLFWHDHFACRIPNAWSAQQMNNTMRRLALGSFRELVHAISKEPAMLQFLNNQQNRKQHPNENFARELMELFTLGIGNYKEQDIKESARAFTGWGFDEHLQYRFRAAQHDFGSKTFFGKTGNFKGEDIINIILEQKQCARYITEKIYRFLVNEQPPSSRIDQLADVFFESDYNIGKLVRTILESNWFYESENIGIKIKSPTELIVGFMREFNVQFSDPKSLIFIQKLLGQVLFFPPGVAGWPRGRQWIDSSSMIYRLRFAEFVLRQSKFNSQLAEGMVGFPIKSYSRKLKAEASPDQFIRSFQNESSTDRLEKMAAHLLQQPLPQATKQIIANELQPQGSPTSQTLTLALLLTKLPEYQLC